MSELTTYNLSLFNKHLLKFRIKYYFKETGELILRHKLLMAFLFCLLAPGIEKIHLIGVPFFVIVAPGISLGIKLLSLAALLSFLFLLIRAQAKFALSTLKRNTHGRLSPCKEDLKWCSVL